MRFLVVDLVLTYIQGFVPRELVSGEVNWFYSGLGIDDTYFQNESTEVISDHIIALFGAKIMAYTKHDPSKLVIDLEKINEDGSGATFIHTSAPGLTSTEGPGATCEARSVSADDCDYHSLIRFYLILLNNYSESMRNSWTNQQQRTHTDWRHFGQLAPYPPRLLSNFVATL